MNSIEQKALKYRLGRYQNHGMEPQFGAEDIEVAYVAGYQRALVDKAVDNRINKDLERLVPRGPFPPAPEVPSAYRHMQGKDTFDAVSDGAARPHNPMMEAAGFTGIHSRLNALYQIVDDLRTEFRDRKPATFPALLAEFNQVRDLIVTNDKSYLLADQIRKVQTEQAGIVSLLEAIHGEVSSETVECVEGGETVNTTDFKVDVGSYGEEVRAGFNDLAYGTLWAKGCEKGLYEAFDDALAYGYGIAKDGKRVDPKDYFAGIDLGKDDFSVFGFVDSAGRLNVYRLPEDAGELREVREVFGRVLFLFTGGLYILDGGKLVKI